MSTLSTIVRLFFRGCPAAIARGVGTVVVDAIKLVFWRRFATHLGEEGGVVVPEELNPASTIAVVVFVFGIIASLVSRIPSLPLRRRFVSLPVAMCSVLAANGRVFRAAARLNIVGLEVWSRDNMIVAAVAAAKPMSIATFCVSQRNDGQKVKALAEKIDDLIFTFGHSDIMTVGDSYVHSI